MISIMKKNAPLGASLIVLSSFFYASYGIWTKLMGDFFGGYTASAFRSMLVLLILVPIAITYRQLERIHFKRDWVYLIGLVIVSLFIWGPLYYAILHGGIGISLTINYASIVIGMFFFGWLIIGERFTKEKLISASLGLIGLGLVFSPNITTIGLIPLTAALISGIAIAAGNVMLKRLPYNASQSTVILWTTSLIANIFMGFVLQEKYPLVGLHAEWLYLFLFAVASVIASWTFIKGLKLIDAGAAGILGLLEIVFGVMFGVLLFHEKPGPIVLLGIMVIILAAAIPYFKDFDIKRKPLN